VVADKRMTSWPSLRQDLLNAGADWVDVDVVADGGLVTSRKPADLHAFNRTLVEEIARRRHHGLSERRIPRKPAART
jgi:protease I